jgi:hypothetical protein
MLEDLVANGEHFPMSKAVFFMGTVKDPVFLPLLEKALQRKDAEQGFTFAAMSCGGKDAIPMLTKALEHPSAPVRNGAKDCLDRLAGKE